MTIEVCLEYDPVVDSDMYVNRFEPFGEANIPGNFVVEGLRYKGDDERSSADD